MVKLKLGSTDKPFLKQGIKSDGTPYSVRDNRDRVFFPNEWIKTEKQLKKFNRFNFEFLLNTGARINEARHVMKQDIDLDNQRIVLRVTKVKAAKGEKNSRPRIIPISTQFTKRLKRVLKPLSVTDVIPILSTTSSNYSLKQAIRRAGIKDYYMFSNHSLRKTLETWLVALDVNPFKIAAHLGHQLSVASGSYIQTDIYTQDEKRTIRSIIGDLYKN